MLTYQKSIVIVCLFVKVTEAIISAGRCQRLPTKSNFDIQKYLGRWYTTEKFFSELEAGLKCLISTYSTPQDDTVEIYNTGVYNSNNTERIITFIAKVTDSSRPERLTVVFPPAVYWILDTDYCNYSLVYLCQEMNGQKSELLYILTRSRFGLTSYIRRYLYRLLHSYGIDPRYFLHIDLLNCPNIPVTAS